MKQLNFSFPRELRLRFRECLAPPAWLRNIGADTLKRDLLAGMTGATIVLPQAIAFSAIAGLPPEYGFYTAMVTSVVAAWFGSSLHAVSGPTTAISALVFGALSGLYPLGSTEFIEGAVALALLAGLIQLALGVARLGSLVSFVSHSVMVGFVTGAALLIAFSQVQHILGIDLPRPKHLVEFTETLVREIGRSDPTSILLASVSLVTAWGIRRFFPIAPNYLLALLASSALYVALGPLAEGVRTIGDVDAVYPRFDLPLAVITGFSDLASPAMAIALVGLLEASAVARSLAMKSGQIVDANREFSGQGLSNIVGSFFNCYPGSASFTRSGVNYDAGAATPVSAICAAVFLFFLLMLVAPAFLYVPTPSMAGVILLVAWRLIDIQDILHIARYSLDEAAVAGVTLFCALFVDLEFSIYAGVFLSTALFMRRSSKPAISLGLPNPTKLDRPFEPMNELPQAHCPQFIVAGVDGPLFFGSADVIRNEFRRIEQRYPQQNYLVLVIKGVGQIDLPAAELLIEEACRRNRRGGGLLIQTKIPRAQQQLRHYNVDRHIVNGRLYPHKGEAIADLFQLLNPEKCRKCKQRIYRECHDMPEV
ncbi:SulP family inorganic anion transporter [Leisingera daeponensis]|uniref:SulP family inorganic anion transporter n=1 Tax=Leisingera daeponensis TaxID=405746 RepID=UPI001C94354B|nr:SulP family inorganic anion transporter [Leisingera daeponensis]MBY6059394.1 SulP family inorganic anion transporter [Leisingera daeponensis]